MSFGDRLAKLRRATGQTQSELARAIGAAQSTISQLEASTRNPSFDMLGALSAALGVTMSALVEEGQAGLTGDEESHFLEYRSLSENARQELRRYAAYLRHRAREAETLTS